MVNLVLKEGPANRSCEATAHWWVQQGGQRLGEGEGGREERGHTLQGLWAR